MQVCEANIQDYKTILAILKRNGLNLNISQKKWIKFWESSPYMVKNPSFPIGWILFSDKKLAVGVLLNIPVEYVLNGKNLLGAVISSWAVDTQYRIGSVQLIMKYFRQKNVDFFLNTTANKDSGAVFEAFKASRVPCLTYDKVLFWIIDYVSFARSILLKKRIPLVEMLQFPAGFLLWFIDYFFSYSSWPKLSTKVIQLDKFDNRFDVFWGNLRKKKNRLLAIRDKATLNWHYNVAQSMKEITILIYIDNDEIVGYIILAVDDNKKFSLKRLRIIDLQVIDENLDVIKDLLYTAIKFSKKQNASVLECIGFSGFKREGLEKFSFFRRKLIHWPFYFKTALRKDISNLDNKNLWDPCLYDADSSLFS